MNNKKKISIITFWIMVLMIIVATIFPSLRIGETSEQRFARKRMEKFLEKNRKQQTDTAGKFKP
jgi:uncharacterized membrane protein